MSSLTSKEKYTTKGWGDLPEYTHQFFMKLFTHKRITAQLLPPNGLNIILFQNGDSFCHRYNQNAINPAGIIWIVQAITVVHLYCVFIQPTGYLLVGVSLFQYLPHLTTEHIDI